MMDSWITFEEWLTTLGEEHGVDPLILGCLYVVSKLSLFTFLGWVVKNIRAKKPFALQLLLAAVSFCVPYTYLIIAGRNISVWVYVFIGTVFLLGIYSIWKKVTEKPALLNEPSE